MPSLDELFAAAIAHHQAGRLPQAERLYRQILVDQPGHADSIHLLGVIAHQVGRHDRAVEYIQYALRLNPGSPAYHNNLGEALRRLGKREEAVENYRQALRIAPDYADAHSNLGATLLELGRRQESLVPLTRAVELNPRHVDGLNNLGNALRESGRRDEAEQLYHRALAENPQYPLAYNNLGVLQQETGRLDEAIANYQQALALNPNYAEAHNGLANTLKDAGRYAEAVEHYRRALAIEPQRPDFHMNLSLVLLLLGEYAEGYREYEWRRKTKLFRPRQFTQPPWTGQSLPDGAVLLYAEQGFGDTLQFIRYAPLVRERVGKVIVECQGPLLPLLQSCAGVDQWIAKGDELPPVDAHASLLSLPGVFQSTPDDLPAEVPYVHPPAERVAYWREQLADLPGLKVGLNWQGNPQFRADHFRSIPLPLLAPLGEIPGVSLVSLQYGAGRDQLATWPGAPLRDLGGEMRDEFGAFVDSAAIMMNLDVVVTSDTAPAHLAGALGRDTRVMLPLAPDWRWLLSRSDSPWYPTMKLYRPPANNAWQSPIAALADDLHNLASG